MLGCGGADLMVKLPMKDLRDWISDTATIDDEGNVRWHLRVGSTDLGLPLDTGAGNEKISLSPYLI